MGVQTEAPVANVQATQADIGSKKASFNARADQLYKMAQARDAQEATRADEFNAQANNNYQAAQAANANAVAPAAGAPQASTSQPAQLSQPAQPSYPQIPTYHVADYSAQINAMYNAQRQQQIQNLKSAYDQNVSKLQQSRAEIKPLYDTQANDLSTQYERTRRSNNLQANINGLNTGTASQMGLAQQSNYLDSYGNIRASQAKAERDVDMAIADLEVNYKNAVAQAISDNDFQRASALMKEYQRRDEALREEQRWIYQQQVAAQRYEDERNRYSDQLAFEKEKYANSQAWQQKQYDFDYQKYQDSLAQQQWQRDFSERQYGDSRDDAMWDRNFNTQKYNDSRADADWEKTYKEQAYRDSRSDADYDRYYRDRAYNDAREDAAWDRSYKERAYSDSRTDTAWEQAYKDQAYSDSRADAAWEQAYRDQAYRDSRSDAAWEQAYKENAYKDSRADTAWEQGYKEQSYNANQSQQQFENSLKNAQIRANYGDFSGYAELYGQDVADAMQDYYDLYYSGSGSGGSGGSSYSSSGSSGSSGSGGSSSGNGNGPGKIDLSSANGGGKELDEISEPNPDYDLMAERAKYPNDEEFARAMLVKIAQDSQRAAFAEANARDFNGTQARDKFAAELTKEIMYSNPDYYEYLELYSNEKSRREELEAAERMANTTGPVGKTETNIAGLNAASEDQNAYGESIAAKRAKLEQEYNEYMAAHPNG